MKTIIVYVDDAAYAQPLLEAAVQSPHATDTHWVVVACAPRITHRVSRFVSNRSRENWRSKWADKLFAQLQPGLQGRAARMTMLLARVPLQELMENVQAEHGPVQQVLDLRRPKMQAEAPTQAPVTPLRKFAGTVAGMGAVWTMLLGETLAA
ncbi:MAG: hypothetical protein Q4B46_05695 [Comamonadaceae bacterium]|nr:hypothetical protein [Comamonadaceae bacterium]